MTPGLRSGRHLANVEIVLRRHSECVGHAIEKREHSDDVNSFGDLVFAPTMVAKFLDIFSRRAIRRFGDEFGVLQQRALGVGEAGVIELAFQNCRYALIIGSLNTQEVSMTIQSIWTAV
jgi:hypothetical protein